jgi:hypothetical protein
MAGDGISLARRRPFCRWREETLREVGARRVVGAALREVAFARAAKCPVRTV